MSFLQFLHGYGARALIIFALALAVWGTYLYFRNIGLPGGYRSAYVIMAGLTAVQGLIGLLALALGGRPATMLHLVYGVFAVLFLPGAYVYARGGTRRREAVVMAGAAWIVSIAYFRGISTG